VQLGKAGSLPLNFETVPLPVHRLHHTPDFLRIGHAHFIFRQTRYSHEDMRIPVNHPAVDFFLSRQMKLARAGGGDEFADVAVVYTCARHDDQSVAGPTDQFGNQFFSFPGAAALAGSKQSFHTEREHVVQSTECVRCHVEGAVKCHCHRPCCCDQLAHSNDIHTPVGLQHADDDAMDTGAFAEGNVPLHHGKLRIVVAKITSAWTNENMEPDAQLLARQFDGRRAGRKAAFDQRRTKLHASCPARLRCNSRLDGVGANFDLDWGVHGIAESNQCETVTRHDCRSKKSEDQKSPCFPARAKKPPQRINPSPNQTASTAYDAVR
jgi:hypothetical protein